MIVFIFLTFLQYSLVFPEDVRMLFVPAGFPFVKWDPRRQGLVDGKCKRLAGTRAFPVKLWNSLSFPDSSLFLSAPI
ncbi:MAG: hypothetical protein C4534_09410 [Gaiellales bacterium]|nr:MAG: hypothetical protein C4534_09410 [Gaiellales bacterium]